MPRVRVGVVLLVPDPVAAEIDGLRRALGDGVLGRVPAHLTLVPPVNVSVDQLDAVRRLLTTAAVGAVPASGPARPGPALRLQLGPPTTFWPTTPVVYLSVSDPPDGPPLEVVRLHALRDAVFRPPLDRPLSYAFVPHVTLADEVGEARIGPAVTALADFRRVVHFERVTLLQEEEGRRWVPIFEAAFSGPVVVGRGGLPLDLSVTPGPRADARRRVGAPDGLAVTATRQDAAVGVAECRLDANDPQRAHLVELWVSPSERGTGVGSHLLAAVQDAARHDLGAAVLLSAAEPDGPLGTFLRHRGFRPHPAGGLARFL